MLKIFLRLFAIIVIINLANYGELSAANPHPELDENYAACLTTIVDSMAAHTIDCLSPENPPEYPGTSTCMSLVDMLDALCCIAFCSPSIYGLECIHCPAYCGCMNHNMVRACCGSVPCAYRNDRWNATLASTNIAGLIDIAGERICEFFCCRAPSRDVNQ